MLSTRRSTPKSDFPLREVRCDWRNIAIALKTQPQTVFECRTEKVFPSLLAWDKLALFSKGPQVIGGTNDAHVDEGNSNQIRPNLRPVSSGHRFGDCPGR